MNERNKYILSLLGSFNYVDIDDHEEEIVVRAIKWYNNVVSRTRTTLLNECLVSLKEEASKLEDEVNSYLPIIAEYSSLTANEEHPDPYFVDRLNSVLDLYRKAKNELADVNFNILHLSDMKEAENVYQC